MPHTDLSSWDLRIFGLVEQERTLNWDELMALPLEQHTSDIHCVTTWSRYDNVWEGIPFQTVLNTVVVKPESQFVMIHAEHGIREN